ncbi:MAG: hypothetical protein FJ265_02400 [Planctomycetes bacterium]|nr:hypothetical protein [Planctomycetota bacterium]
MSLVTTMLCLPLLQQPPPAPTFVWPPQQQTVQNYRARLAKARTLSKELATAERKAREAAGLPTPSRPPPQQVSLEIDVELQPGADAVVARYATRLQGRPQLRLRLRPDPPPPGEAAPPLGNDSLLLVWGHADRPGQTDLELPEAALQRRFEQRFLRQDRGVARGDFAALYGDHLLPLLWEQPLPCWVGHMADVVELHGQPAVAGKSLIRDGSGSHPLGHRETRVELQMPEASADAFTIRYTMQVRQTVDHSRDLRRRVESYDWVFAIDGEARYAASQQAFVRIREQVRAWPERHGEALLRQLADQAFTGSIDVERVREEPKPEPRRRK